MSDLTQNQQATGQELANAQSVSITLSDTAAKALANTEGIIVGEIGTTKVARVPIEKYKASTQKIDRISFISKQVIAVKMHYFEDVGSVLCFGKKCCAIAGLPQVRYLFPILVYQTDNEGTIVGNKVELRILSAGEDFYKSIITIHRATVGTGGIESVDLLVTCTDDKYQKMTLNQAGPAVWKTSKKLMQFIADKWAESSEFAYMAVARKVDEADLLKLLDMEGESIPAGGSAPAGSPGAGINPASNQNLAKFFED